MMIYIILADLMVGESAKARPRPPARHRTATFDAPMRQRVVKIAYLTVGESAIPVKDLI